MANSFEEGMAHANKGLSFIDWDILDHDEYDKLSKIISTSNKSSGVQLLFEEDELDNCEAEEESSDNSEVIEEASECEEEKGARVVDVENSVLHPAAPVFRPSIPPPNIMTFPYPMHHWPHGDHNMPPHQPQAAPYSYHMPGGYVFHHDPNLAAHNGEATVAFVTLSNGQSAYAFPGHPIPAHHFQPTTIASGIPQMSNMAPRGDVMIHPVSGTVIPTTPSHHPLVFPPHITTTMGQPLPAHIVPPHTVSQHPPPNQHSTQFIYVPPMPPASTAAETANPCANNETSIIDIEPAPDNNSSPEEKVEEEERPQNLTKAASAIPDSPSKSALSDIEFGGPVVFDIEQPSVENSSSSLQQTPSKSPAKDKSKQSPPVTSPVQEVSVKEKLKTVPDYSPPHKEKLKTVPDYSPPPKEKLKTVPDSSPRTNARTDKVLENTTISIPQNDIVKPVNNSVSSMNTNQSSNVNKSPSSPTVHELPVSNINASSPLSHVNTTPPSSTVNVNSTSPNTAKGDASSQKSSPSNEIKNKVETDTKPPLSLPTHAPAPKTWSSLFGKQSQNTPSPVSPLSHSNVTSELAATDSRPPANSSADPEVKSVRYWQEQDKQKEKVKAELFPGSGKKIKAVDVRQDPLAPKLLAKLSDFPISHIPIIVQPRGLKNGNNICFMNATLQVLMGCPPFIHLFRAFRNLPARSGSNSSTPVFDALVQFVNSFQNCQRVKQQGPPKNKKGTGYDINVGVPFIPESLLAVAQHILGLKIGVQHDAEEFLSQILSICNEEVEKIIQMKNMDSCNNNNTPTVPPKKAMGNGSHHQNGSVNGDSNHMEEGEDDGDDSWVQVGPRNYCVETNVNNCGQTPLSAIFAGLSRSCLVRDSGKTSDTVDSFFTLKLDIQVDSVHTVRDALARLNATEEVHGVDGRKVNGHRRMFFDVLPPVLIMHLKLFEYSNGNGQKIQKHISFDVDLQIPKEILSRAGRSKYPALKSRSYKLFGVVNHHGTKMNDGHYTSDVFLPVVNGWLHFDDSDVSINDEATVLKYVDKSMPYLLFYRRMDV